MNMVVKLLTTYLTRVRIDGDNDRILYLVKDDGQED